MIELHNIQLLRRLVEVEGEVLERWWLCRLGIVVIEKEEIVVIVGLSCRL
jgi:hypothetical protein